MGSTTSKPQEVKTFIPQTPVEFSSSLLAQLENSTEYAETYIQQRVNEELKTLQKSAIDSLNKSLDASSAKKDDSLDKSSRIANEKLDAITKKLKDLNELKPKISDELKKSKVELVKCLKDNQGKPLNCWNEVEAFKTLVNKL